MLKFLLGYEFCAFEAICAKLLLKIFVHPLYQHQSEITNAHNELGSMVLEFDNLQKLNKRMTEDAAKVEKEFYAICQKFQQEKIDWKSEQIRQVLFRLLR